MRARSLAAAVLALALAGSSLTGCVLARATGKAVGSLFMSPRKVEQLKEPIDKNARLAVLWVGHATALVQIDDKVILTDPVFTTSVGQLSKRLVEPGLDAANLPPVDAVVISHMHFDHLSLGSLDMIQRKVRMLLMPRGGATYLTDFGFPVLELRPWQAYEKDGLRVTAVPVDHVGFRYGVDAAWMTQSFTGYVVEYHGIKVYFGGDTGYDQKLFVEVGSGSRASTSRSCRLAPSSHASSCADSTPTRVRRCRRSSISERSAWCPSTTTRSSTRRTSRATP